MKVDLHCHSTASDGLYTPHEVYRQAVLAGVELLALTDHDTVAGVLALQGEGQTNDACSLLPGIEFSCLWRKRNIHVVGLGIDTQSQVITDAEARQRRVRLDRARHIGGLLARRGVAGAFEGALAIADAAVPCRPHFADFLIAQGYCRDSKAAFKQYLGNRHIAGIEQAWPDLAQVVGWIVDAGGVAVLAHPEAYGLTRTKLRELVIALCEAGGEAMELPSPDKPGTLVEFCEQLCREFALRVSVGSDFHGPLDGWRHLGQTRAFAPDLRPVWELFVPGAASMSDRR
jgi:predicted metal-dependent phosphoesterase TrpH